MGNPFAKLFIIYILFFSLNSIGLAQNFKWNFVVTGEGYHTFAIRNDGTLWGTGWNQYAQLGINSTIQQNSFKQIGKDKDWKNLAPGFLHTLALKQDSTLWAWGFNRQGQVGDGKGDGSVRYQYYPIQIGNNKWIQISAGFQDFSLGIKEDSTLWGWGIDHWTAMTGTFYPTPVQIGKDKWRFVYGGDLKAMGIKLDGTLWAWGWDPITQKALAPFQIGNDSNWVKICGNKDQFLGLKKDSSLWAYGSNKFGLLGKEDTTLTFTYPEKINEDKDWIDIAQNSSAVAIKKDGTLWSWGYNYKGETGHGDTIIKKRVEKVNLPYKVSSISMSLYHTLIVKSDSTGFCFSGENTFGSFGISSIKNTTSFVCFNESISSVKDLKSKSNHLSLYPNPSSNSIIIESSIDEIFSLINEYGQEIKIVTLEKDIEQFISLEELSSGVYYLISKNSEINIRKKLVVIK